jgi:hypothetical protein
MRGIATSTRETPKGRRRELKSSLSRRAVKGELKEILLEKDRERSREALARFPQKRLISSLIALLCDGDPLVRGEAVVAIGEVTARLARDDMEFARVIMRRFLWSLNDESGGIGWGAAEAMAEIMRRSESLAAEYARFLVSYADPRGNFLEHEPLHPGLMWAIARLAESRPETLEAVIPHLGNYLRSKQPAVRGLAATAAGFLGARELLPQLRALRADDACFPYFWDGLLSVSVGEAARRAISVITGGEHPHDAGCREPAK